MSDLIAKQAQLAAARVDDRVTAEMGGITVITEIFTQVFNFLIACKNRETPNPAEVQASVAEENEQNPKKLLRRTARRIRANADDPMTKAESFELARASIEQALAMDGETAHAMCAAVPCDLVLNEDD